MLFIISVIILMTYIGIILTFVSRYLLKRHHYVAMINKIPGPKGIPVFGNSLQLLKPRNKVVSASMDLFLPMLEKHSLVRIWLGPIPVVVLIKAESAKILLSSNKEIDKAVFYKYLHNWIGDGLLTSTGLKWQQRRKHITPSFHFQILEHFLVVMNEQAKILTEVLKKKCRKMTVDNEENFDIYPYITRCTLDIICETAMGQGVNAQVYTDSEYVNAVNNVSEAISFRILRPWLASNSIYQFSWAGQMEKRSLKIIHGFTNKIIKMKREKLAQPNNDNGVSDNVKIEDEILGKKRRLALLDMLLENSQEYTNGFNYQPMTDADIREEVDTFMFEGHDTTSVGISWALYAIGHSPDIQQKLINELDEIFGDSNREVNNNDLRSMKYLDCAIKEALRIWTSVPLYGRQLKEDTEICGYTVPAGTMTVVVPFMVHMDPAQYPDPLTYNPDRFLPENIQNKDPFSFIPFSAGPRNCIGYIFFFCYNLFNTIIL
ncbi:hypothetical protein CHUAL_008366 [Chamberlinius hualienensis]